jgi:uncharacterized protein YeaO (DUF488 family)
VARRYFEHAARVRQAPRLVEKSALHLHHHDTIAAAFPDARLLVTVRHPVDVFTSFRRRYRAEWASGHAYKAWLDVRLGDFVTRYRRDVQAVQAVLATSISTRLVRYEDFVSDPHAAFASICAFADVPFEAAALETATGKQTWKPDPYLSRPITQQTKQWSDYMHEREAQWMEQQLAPSMRALGYAPHTDVPPTAEAATPSALTS